MTKKFDHGYALLIAVNESSVSTAALPDVIKDATALRDVLVHPDRCAYASKNVNFLAGKESTRAGIAGGLDWLRDKLEADTSGEATAIIYFTGHGHTEVGKYYLIPYDVNLKRIKTSALGAEDFADDVAALQPRRLLVVFDCCHAAGMEVKDVAARDAIRSTAVPPALFMTGQQAISIGTSGKGLETLARGSGRAVLNSCQATEQSYIRKDRKMSIFTYHLIEALTGRAQPEAGAQEVLVSDIVSHIHRRVPDSARFDWQADQHPWCEVSGNFPVALLLGGKGLGANETAPDPLQLKLPPERTGTSFHGKVTGPGALAQGPNSTALGQGAMIIHGDNKGNANTGTQTFTNTDHDPD